MSEEDRADFNPAARMIKLSGKEYLQVADRIVWFRNDYPEGSIETLIVSIDEERGSAIFRAEVCTGKGGRATATGSETLKDFPQGWIEKAEAKAVGRALGYLGYGTASAGFEEGQRVVDAPQQATSTRAPARLSAPSSAPRPAAAPTAAAGTPTPLTEEQERVLVQVKEMAEANETYGATKALVQTLEIAATDAEWTEIRRRWFRVREVHYPLTIKQAASQAG